MDHSYIDESLIIERFVTGDLSRDERREFFEHCLSCNDCLASVSLALKIDEGLQRAQIPYRKQPVKKPTARRTVIPYMAGAGMIIVAFVAGWFISPPGKNETGTFTAAKSDTVQNTTGTTSVIKADSVPVQPVRAPQQAERVAVQPRQTPGEKEPDMPVRQEPAATFTEADINMNDINHSVFTSVLAEETQTRGGEASTKGGSLPKDRDETLPERINEELSKKAQYPSPSLRIIKPGFNSETAADQPFEAEWNPVTPSGPYLAIILSKQNHTIRSYTVNGMKFRPGIYLPKGEYFFILKEKNGKKAGVVSFSVK